MENIKMIVTDLDNTLLNSKKDISDYTVSVLKKCRQNGIKVAFATARSEKSCERFIAQFEPDAMISNGGALAKANGESIYCALLTQETANSLIKSIAGTPTVGYITVEAIDGYLVNHPIDTNLSGWLDYTHGIPFDFVNGSLTSDVYKLTVEISDALVAYNIAKPFPYVDILPFSGENWYRYAHKSATKWNALKELAKHLNIDSKDIAAFGDDYNDVEMIQNCGVGIAMGNAIDEVKKIAFGICKSNDEDGVAHWLCENIAVH